MKSFINIDKNMNYILSFFEVFINKYLSSDSRAGFCVCVFFLFEFIDISLTFMMSSLNWEYTI